MPLSTYASTQLANWLLHSASTASPATLYFGLSTTAPTLTGGNVTEPVAGSGGTATAYARVAYASTSSNWTAPSGQPGQGYGLNNANTITFPTSTYLWAGGQPLDYALLFDAATAGNLWAYGQIQNPNTISAAGQVATLSAQQFLIVIGAANST